MNDLIFDDILKQREERNERIVAFARLIFISFAGVMDWLSYLQIIQYTEIDPDKVTLLLDIIFIIFSAVVLIVVTKFSYNPYLKFFTITLDYFFIGLMLRIDPTIPKDAVMLKWIAMVASIFIFMYNLIRFSKSATLYSGFLSVLFFLCLIFFSDKGFVPETLPILISLIMLIMLGYYITTTNANMMREANTKKMMERFLPPQLLDELYKHQDNLTPSGNHQKVTILFSDIRSFTELSESLPAKEVVSLLNDYLTSMTEIIFRHEGTIDKFIGDAIMTLYGAPLQTENDEIRAIETALDMIETLPNINGRHEYLKKPIQIGIGIHSGDVIIGNIGSQKRLDYTAIGDNVNLASRIESLTKYYQCKILISESTFAYLKLSQKFDTLILRELDKVQVKGKTTDIILFEVMGRKTNENSMELETLKNRFESGLSYYKSRAFQEAKNIFDSIPDDVPSFIFANRCLNFLKNPPEESWNGNYQMTEK